MINEKLSKQILTQARIQLEELEEESLDRPKTKKNKEFILRKPPSKDDDDEEDEDDDDAEDVDFDGAGHQIASSLRINPKDERAFEEFMNKNDEPRRTLADIIMEKINEKKTEIDTQFTDTGSLDKKELDPRVVEMYRGVGKVLAKYRSGKVPKAFKV